MTTPKYDYGAAVRVRRSVRNDGTFPGVDTGTLLVRCGSVGYVRDVGTFLQDQIIYSVHFLEQNRCVGCREEELQLSADPWVNSQYETRDWVTPRMRLAVHGEVIASPGTRGKILRVLRDQPGGVAYQVEFGERTLQVPEQLLDPTIV